MQNQQSADSTVNLNGYMEEILKSLPLTILLIGPTCCGKGTNAELLKEALNSVSSSEEEKYGKITSTHIINTGKLLRSLSDSQNTPDILKESLKKSMGPGGLTSTASKVSVWFDELKSVLLRDQDFNLIFDGSPRDVVEANILLQTLINDFGRKNIVAIHFTPSVLKKEDDFSSYKPSFEEFKDELRKRVIARGRWDDNDESFQRKMKIYEEEVPGAIGVLRSYKIPIQNLRFEKGRSEEAVFECFLKKINKTLRDLRIKQKAGN